MIILSNIIKNILIATILLLVAFPKNGEAATKRYSLSTTEGYTLSSPSTFEIASSRLRLKPFNLGVSWEGRGQASGLAVIYSMVQTSDNSIFVGGENATPSGVVSKYDGSNWTSWQLGQSTRVWSLARGSNEVVFAGVTRDGAETQNVYQYVNNTWEAGQIGTVTQVRALFTTSVGTVFAGTGSAASARNVFSLSGANWQSTALVDRSPGASIVSLTEGTTGEIFAGTAGGVVYRRAATWDTGTALSGTGAVNTLFNFNGIPFAGQGANVYKYQNNQWDTGTTIPNITDVYRLLGDSSNNLYAGTNNEVFRSTDGGTNWIQVLNLSGLISVRAFLPANDGSLWAGTSDGTLYQSSPFYSSVNPTVTSGASDAFSYERLSSFSVSTGTVEGEIKFQISRNGSNWYYWSGTSWTAVPANDDITYSNTSVEVNTNIAQFPVQVGTGSFYWKAFFRSNGRQRAELTSVSVGYSNSPSGLTLVSPTLGEKVTATRPQFSWQLSRSGSGETVSKYVLYYSKSSDFSTSTEAEVATPDLATTYTPTTALDEGFIYYWKVKAVNSSSLEVWSDSSHFIVGTVTTIQQVKTGPSPFNPATASSVPFQFSYVLNDNMETKLFIFDLAGNLVYQTAYSSGANGGRSGTNSPTWNGSNQFGAVVENGVYLYKISSGGRIIASGKFVVLR